MQITLKDKMIAVAVFLMILTGCAGSPGEDRTRPEREAVTPPVTPAATLSGRIESPSDGDVFQAGDNIGIRLLPGETSGDIESVSLTVDGRSAGLTGTFPGPFYWDASGERTGTRLLRINIGYDDGTAESYPLRLELRSDIVPVRYTYRIVNSYPHDIRAFTQGLVYDSGFLYESTGQYGQSSLRKVQLETGEVLRSLSLDRSMFGEGLCIHDGKLYQLTWQSRVGFIYDIETFRLLNRVHYQTEGWGLTTDGTNLLKSDGSHILYVLDPQYFTEVDRVEVYDNRGRAGNLNELEFIDGMVYSNVFGTDEIVIIERITGRVTGVIDLTGLLDRRYHHPALDVLNGIAYDHDNDRLFVTGKNWPRLFEIELVEVN